MITSILACSKRTVSLNADHAAEVLLFPASTPTLEVTDNEAAIKEAVVSGRDLILVDDIPAASAILAVLPLAAIKPVIWVTPDDVALGNALKAMFADSGVRAVRRPWHLLTQSGFRSR